VGIAAKIFKYMLRAGKRPFCIGNPGSL